MEIYFFRAVLTSKRRGQIPLKDLWFRKVELAESLRILKDLEMLRNTPSVVLRSIEQRRWSPLPLHHISSYLNLIPWYLILPSLILYYYTLLHSSFSKFLWAFLELWRFWIVHPRINLISKMILCSFISTTLKFSNFVLLFTFDIHASIRTNASLTHSHTHTHACTYVT